MVLRVPEPLMASLVSPVLASARPMAWMELRLPPSGGNEIFMGAVGLAPSGGRSRLMLGTGMGMGILPVMGSMMVMMTTFLARPSRLKVRVSTLLFASMLTVRAGCGMGMRMSGPK